MEKYLQSYDYATTEVAHIDSRCKDQLDMKKYYLLLPALKNISPNVLPFITSLNISGCKLQLFPYVLKSCKCLQDLTLSNNDLKTLPSLFIVYYFPFLKLLDVSDNQISTLESFNQLSCMQDLELLNCFGNPIPKLETRIELLESLFYSTSQSFEKQYEEGIRKNPYSVFLKMGSYLTVKNNYAQSLIQAIKADQFLQLNPIDKLHTISYDLMDLNLDVAQLLTGQQFKPIDSDPDIFIQGPGFYLQKDERLEAPIVQIGSLSNKTVSQQKITRQTRDLINKTLSQVDQILGKVSSQELVPQQQLKFGFFGQQFFCYQLSYKQDQFSTDSKKIKLNTTELINKRTIKDFKIQTDIPQNKLELMKINVKTTLPTEIENIFKKHLNETHFFLNMNQRTLQQTKLFPRLRVLNGEIITVNDIDKANNLHQRKITIKEQTEAAAFMHCKTKIPPMLKQSVEQYQGKKDKVKQNDDGEHKKKPKINTLAQQDLQNGMFQVGLTRPLSEVIKRRQIYERLLQQSKIEKQEALQQMRDFLVKDESELLNDFDDELKFAMLLKKYDLDQDTELGEFMKQCHEFTLKQAQKEDNEVKKVEASTYLASSIMNDKSKITPKGPFSAPNSANSLTKIQDVAPQIFRQSSLKKSFLKLDDLDVDDNHLLTNLALQTPSMAMRHKLAKTGKAESDHPKEESSHEEEIEQSRINVSLVNSVKQQIESQLMEDNKKVYVSNCLITAPGMQSSMLIQDDVALQSNNKMKMSTDPLLLIKESLPVYQEIQQQTFPEACRSKIMREVFMPESSSLPLDKILDPEALRQISPSKEFTNTDNLSTIRKSPQKLMPDFHMVLRNELNEQRKETDQLFVHIAKNIDPHVRKQLKTDHFTYQNVERHSSLLDAVMEGDQISGNPNVFKLESQYIGKIKPEKMNEAQEIMMTGKTPIPYSKKLIKTPNSVLQHTSKEIMNKIDDEIHRQNLRFEAQRHVNQKCDQDAAMKQLIKQNNEDIQRTQQNAMMKKHHDNLRLIATEPALPDTKQSPLRTQLINEQRKLNYIMAKQVKSEQQEIQNNYVNEALRYQNISDKDAIQPVRISSTALRQKYGEFSQPLNVASVEEAASHATLMKVEAAELIKQSSYIMTNSNQEIKNLENYQKEFIERQIQWDTKRSDPIEKLLSTNIDGDILHEVAGKGMYEKVIIETGVDMNGSLVKGVEARLNGDLHDKVTREFNDIKKYAEEQIEKLYMDDV
ncbi:Conserved_hypothetical protein [Hexamita inflata]|uniref:Leucine-rich repeat-containing protein n=1 Tax=Hexamita inflata TaxID=28002 RepID=A0AA86NGP3_9EUKA|nr:Conserved hypothetical protein [Hexamita inflata]